MLPDASTDKATASSLAEFTRCDLILPELRERDPAGIIAELSRALGQSDCVSDVLSFYQAALNQEILSGCVIQSQFVMAHARSNGVKRLQFAFGRSPVPILWNIRSLRPLQLIFLLAVPATESASYLRLLANIFKLSQSPDTVAKLIAAPDEPAILAIFETITPPLEISNSPKFVIL